MNNACPECGVIYAVAEKDIGRRIACKKCSASLIVTEKGLEDDSDAGPAPREDATERERGRDRDRDDDDRGRRRRNRDDNVDERPRKPRGEGAGQIFNKIKSIADVPTWLYGFGLLLTIFSFYAPALDQASLDSRKGDQLYADTADRADQREVDSSNDGKPSESERKDREKRKKTYEKEVPILKEKVEYAQANVFRAEYWDTMYRIVGLIVLAFGAIGFLIGENAPTKRILGAVTIGIILLHVVGGGAGIHLQAGK